MQLKIARIVDVLSAAENSKFGAHRVKLSFQDSVHEVTGYAKELKDLDILVELMCTLLGRESGIPMPEPVLAFSMDGNKVLFATIDVRYPDLTKLLFIDPNLDVVPPTTANMEILKKLSDWEYISESIAFDEWIANEDRHVGNVLYDGDKTFMLIDNNLAMRPLDISLTIRPPFSPEHPILNNQLLAIHMLFNQDEVSKQRVKSKLSSLMNFFDENLPSQIGASLKQQLSSDVSLIDKMVEFLNKRLIHISKITAGKIPVKQQGLF